MATILTYENSLELSELYTKRETIDPQRQPELFSEFNELSNALNTFCHNYRVPFVSPYASRDFVYYKELNSHLRKCSCLTKKLYEAYPAKVTKCEYLYRFQDFDRLLDSHISIDSNLVSDSAIADRDFEYENLKSTEWNSLTRLLNKYNPNEDMVWWTADDIESISPYIARLKLGLISKGIPSRAILLRLHLNDKNLNSLFVPNCVEAYNMPIFYSQRKGSSTGITIDLEKQSEGFSELIGRHFDVNQIEIRFCDIQRSENPKYAPNAELPKAYLVTKSFLDSVS